MTCRPLPSLPAPSLTRSIDRCGRRSTAGSAATRTAPSSACAARTGTAAPCASGTASRSSACSPTTTVRPTPVSPAPRSPRCRDLLAAGSVDVVVAWHPDRLTRHPRELEDLIDLLESTSTTVRTVQTGEYDLATPSGRMTARIVGAVARGESEHKSARLRRKHLELAETGHVSGGGDRPFGYELDRVTIRPAEADIVREAAGRVLAGESVRSICNDLNDRGVTTTAGRTWYPSALRRLLVSARIAGLRAHRGTVTADAVWPAIIDPAEHRRLAAILQNPERTRDHGRERRLLTGLLICGQCGAKLVSQPRADKQPAYACTKNPGAPGCGGCKILGDPLDDLVVAVTLERLATPELARLLTERRGDDADDLVALDEIDTRLAELGQMWATGELDRASWHAARDELERRRAEAQRRLADAGASTAVEMFVDERIDWPALPHGRRRAVLAALIDTITIGPAVRGRNYFDAGRVSISWKA